MVQKLGIVVPDLTHSQLTFDVLESIDTYVDKGIGPDITLFYENVLPMHRLPKTGLMNMYECWGYDGHLVSTNLGLTHKLLTTYGAFKLYYYMYNFEWIYNHNQYLMYYNIIKNNIPIIARTEDHANIISNNFNTKPIFTLEQMDVEELWNKITQNT